MTPRTRIGFRNRLRSAWQKVMPQRNNDSTRAGLSKRRVVFGAAAFVVSMLARPLVTLAMGGMGGSKGPVAPMERKDMITIGGLFFVLFVGLALLHAAEIAITTLYPWKVREFAEEEEKSGKQGVFKILDEDITRVLTTILVASTTCSIFATTVFTHLVASAFGARGERYGALALTCLTLFFVELLPKSIGVTNAEKVARIMTPPIIVTSTIVSPIGISLTWLAKKTLALVGFKSSGDGDSISDSQLRLIVTGARDSGTIDRGEQEMIQGVLELQTQRVKEIMKPRVEIIAVQKDMSVASVLGVVRESGYSRIPVYDGEIDNIVGIVLAKNVLDFFVKGVLVDDEVIRKIRGDETSMEDMSDKEVTRKLATVSLDDRKTQNVLTGSEMAKRMQESIMDAGLIESCYFVPETANGWSVLQEMRKRRVHMAVVVDEFGGTEGLVSLEDIVEEVVGEIYDEDDEEEYDFSEDSITLQEDGSFLVRGDADLEDCDTILDLKLSEEDALREFSTLSGFLCMCAGEIPNMGDFVMSRGYSFEILQADDKKILQIKVERLIGAFDDEDELDDESKKMLRGFVKNKLEDEDDYEDMESEVDDQLEQTRAANKEAAKEIEQLIEGGAKKADLVEKALSDIVSDS
ncbi:unnamed protein product [Cylindrotheca closterium]|uniref:Uncharacterized protein n=1 Tax=Cylindrotheca closterium TaxID=2856 RepID=A0AAD2PW04_9STRA|nr:unnamed protein product [Cylindrotheca closterium]